MNTGIRTDTRRAGALILSVLILATMPLSSAGHLPELLAQENDDGGHTLRLLIDDGTGGRYDYTSVDISGGKDTLVGVLHGTGNPVAQEVAGLLEDLDEPVTEAGAYTHAWDHGGSPMLTVGVYLVHRDEGLIRAPLLLFENVTSTSHLAGQIVELILEDGVDMAIHVLPFLLESALVELNNGFQEYPDPDNVHSYKDKPTIYAWHARKVEAGQSIWQGWYVQRTGEYEGTSQGAGSFDGTKRMEVGSAMRLGGVTEHVAAVYLETDLGRENAQDGGQEQQQGSWQATIGLAGEQTGSVPLVTVNATDERWDTQGDPYTTPDEQRTRFTVGVWVGDAFVPLVGVETHATHRHYACPEQPSDQPNPLSDCIEQVRTHSVGTFVDDEYVPVAGERYHGERLPLSAWVFAWVGGGGPGAQNAGDWTLQTGLFVEGEFVPVVGVHYDQAFPEARDTYQMRITAGVYVLDAYQPILGVTYDGKRPMLMWVVGAMVSDDRDEAKRWMVSTGTYAFDHYVPVFGVRYLPYAENGDREHQHQLAMGTYLGDYAFFVPLVGAQWDGDRGPVDWGLVFTGEGLLGGGAGEWDLNLGVFLLGTYQPVLGVESRDEYDGTTGPHDAEQEIRAGVYDVDSSFVPLVGVTYGGDASMMDAMGAPTTFEDAQEFRVTAGVYVQGEFQPLVGIHHTRDGARVTVLPSDY